MKKVQEKGFALVLSLVLLLVMSLMGGSLIVIASGDHKNNNTSDQYQQAFYVAETGLMEGEKWVIDNYLGPWHKAGTAEDPYAGTVPTYEDTMKSKDASFKVPEKDDDKYAEYEANLVPTFIVFDQYGDTKYRTSGVPEYSFINSLLFED